MLFPNLEANLTMDDMSLLNEIQLKLTFKDNPEIKLILVKNGFGKVTSTIDSKSSCVSVKHILLTDLGKKNLQDIIAELKDLDAKFSDRSKLVEDFAALLNE
jgi:hypothetical protein